MMKGLLIFSHHMEDVEALGTRALLKRAGLDITTATFEDTLEIQTSYGLSIKADYFAFDLQMNNYDFLIIPGGRYVSLIVDQDVNIKRLCKEFHHEKKMIAAICAGPRFLGQAGLLDGIHFTAYTNIDDAPQGIYHKEVKTIVDQSIITARSAGAVYEFAYEIVKYLLGEDKAVALLKNIQY